MVTLPICYLERVPSCKSLHIGGPALIIVHTPAVTYIRGAFDSGGRNFKQRLRRRMRGRLRCSTLLPDAILG